MGDMPMISWSPNVEHWQLENDLNEPVAALQLQDGKVNFVHGKTPKLDRDLVDTYIIPFLKAKNLDVVNGVDGYGYVSFALGYVADVHSEWHHVSELPDGLTIAGKFDLYGLGLRQLPNNMTIRGELWVRDPLEALPDGLTVETLDICDTVITRFPKGLNVINDVRYDSENITEFPEDMLVDGKPAREVMTPGKARKI